MDTTPKSEKQALLGALRKQKARGYWHLSFPPLLERHFRLEMARTANTARIALLCAYFVASMGVLFVSRQFDTKLVENAMLDQLVTQVIVPMLAVSAFLLWMKPQSKVAEWCLFIVYAAVCGAELFLRSVSALNGHNFPLIWVVSTTIVFFLAARIRFWSTLFIVVLVMLTAAVNEIAFVVHAPQDYFLLNLYIDLMAVAVIGGYAYEYYLRKTWVDNRLLYQVPIRDALTYLPNRHAIRQTLRPAFEFCQENGHIAIVVMMDIYGLKHYNQTHGYLAGDHLLRRLAHVLVNTAHNYRDICGRYSDKCFVTVNICESQIAAQQCVERLRFNIDDLLDEENKKNNSRALSIHIQEKIINFKTQMYFDAQDDRAILSQIDQIEYSLHEEKFAFKNIKTEGKE